jgi:hypothetical protein
MEKINVNGIPTDDPIEIANQFNTFFTTAGQQISTMYGLLITGGGIYQL